MTDPWIPETRDVIPELEPDYEHETYPPTPVHFVPLAEKLDTVTRDKLLEMARAIV